MTRRDVSDTCERCILARRANAGFKCYAHAREDEPAQALERIEKLEAVADAARKFQTIDGPWSVSWPELKEALAALDNPDGGDGKK